MFITPKHDTHTVRTVHALTQPGAAVGDGQNRTEGKDTLAELATVHCHCATAYWCVARVMCGPCGACDVWPCNGDGHGDVQGHGHGKHGHGTAHGAYPEDRGRRWAGRPATLSFVYVGRERCAQRTTQRIPAGRQPPKEHAT